MVSRKQGGRAADLISLSQVTPFSIPRKKPKDHSELQSLIQHALAHGARRVSVARTAWDISGNCEDGYTQEFCARPPAKGGSYAEIIPGRTKHTLILEVTTRCRRCKRCLHHRAALWRSRVLAETRDAPRTWFGTLTLRPGRQYYYWAAARVSAAKEGIDFDALSDIQQFIRRDRLISPEITKAIKRLRKNTGIPFKYIIVAEAHKSGAPHYHLLFHERSVDKQLRYADLKTMWPLGFSQFKLVGEAQQASYLCKYLSKSMLARVRASLRYGDGTDHTVLYHSEQRERVNPTTPKKSIF